MLPQNRADEHFFLKIFRIVSADCFRNLQLVLLASDGFKFFRSQNFRDD